jgi:hypothetical protein
MPTKVALKKNELFNPKTKIKRAGVSKKDEVIIYIM